MEAYIVGAIIAVAAIYTVYRLIARPSCGCGSSCGCHPSGKKSGSGACAEKSCACGK